MITLPPPPEQWGWRLLPALVQRAFAPVSDEPLPIWANKNVFLGRKITTKPGYYDPDEFGWTWELQEIIRTRKDPWKGEPVEQISVLKSSVAGFTEAALNGIRWIAANDPQNVIFAIDSAKEAASINEVRLQPTLRALGAEIFTDDEDDVGRYLLNLQRMLVYFLGSYSEAAFANKMAELAIGDELEEHGDPNTVENLRSRLKSALKPLLVLLSKPKLAGGPIDAAHSNGTMHVYEIPCPHCGGYQQLLQENMVFDHCKDLYGEWDLARVRAETYFRCIHCRKPIEEHWKRWFNDRTRRRWTQTNPNPEPRHVSFHMSDFYGYHPDAEWGRLAVKYINSKGDPVARKEYRNHHEGLPWEVRSTKTDVEDILLLRAPYRRGTVPWEPMALLLAADVGLTYVRWSVTAFRADGESATVDWGNELHPKDLIPLLKRTYPCASTEKKYEVTLGFIDAKYRKPETHAACYRSRRKLWPVAGINADFTQRSISFNGVPGMPKWYGIIVFVDRDAKTELYSDRITEWVEWERRLKHLPPGDERKIKPDVPRLWFPEDLRKDDDFLKEHTTERLVELTSRDKGWMPHAAKQFIWKRKGPNHFGDCTKLVHVGFRYLTRKTDPGRHAPSEDSEPEQG